MQAIRNSRSGFREHFLVQPIRSESVRLLTSIERGQLQCSTHIGGIVHSAADYHRKCPSSGGGPENDFRVQVPKPLIQLSQMFLELTFCSMVGNVFGIVDVSRQGIDCGMKFVQEVLCSDKIIASNVEIYRVAESKTE